MNPEGAVKRLVVVVLGVELILAPPTELELAERALHELAASTALDDHLAAGAFLAQHALAQIAENRQVPRYQVSDAEGFILLSSPPLVPAVSALVVVLAYFIRVCESKTLACRIRARSEVGTCLKHLSSQGQVHHLEASRVEGFFQLSHIIFPVAFVSCAWHLSFISNERLADWHVGLLNLFHRMVTQAFVAYLQCTLYAVGKDLMAQG